jgi:hypothetical protein|nr:MAG TPA: major capsid protein [Caudoviricetes sp.]
MATLAANVLTLADWAKRIDPDGKTPAIVELLSQTNEILLDMLWKEGNLPTGERTTIRTGLPTVYWRTINQGTQPSKSTTAQIDESCGMLEAWSEVDKDLALLNGNVNSFRLSESQAFIEAMNQEASSSMFYGNASLDPEEFNGLAVRYSSLSANNGQNIVVGGGSQSDNMSVWLVVWGQQTCFGVFPKGSKAGLDHEDLGLVTVETTAGVAGSRMRAYQDHFQWKMGIVLKDWRYVVRIANIDKSNLVSESSAADLTKLMIKAIHRIPNIGMGKPVFYMNRTCFEFLDIQRLNNVRTGAMTYEEVDGKAIAKFRGIPIRICDALTEAEATVS